MKYLVAALLCVALAAGCSRRTGLGAIPEADKLVLGELKKTETAGDVTDPAAVARARAFANELRAGTWSDEPAVHSSCGTVLMLFHSKGKVIGYLGLDGETFFTNGPGGEHQQPATAQALGRFLALLPRWYHRSQCLA